MTWPDNKTLFRWHGWLGLNLGLLLFVICFSGTIAVFSYEIDALIDSDQRVTLDPDAPPVNWTAMYDSVRTAYPYHRIIFMMTPRHDGLASHVYAAGPGGRNVKLYVHPQTGAVQQMGNFWNVQRFFRSFHRRMFFPNPFGLVWVTLFALALLGSAVTGILFYKGWYRNLFRLRWRDARLLFSDGHRLVGVWSLAFAVIIIATGVWYVVELVAPAETPGVPEMQAPPPVSDPASDLLSLNEQVAIAQEAFPGLEVEHVWPGTATRAAEIRGQGDALLVRPRANRVRVHPATGEVTLVQKATEIGAYQRWSDMADPLHFGTFGGLWSQALWFLFGLMLSSLMLTGGWLWHLKAERRARASGARRHPRWSYAAAAVPIVAIVASGVYGYLEVQQYFRKPDASAHLMTRQALGPWEGHLVRNGALAPGASPTLILYLWADTGAPRYRKAAFALVEDGTTLKTIPMEGDDPIRAKVPLPAYRTLDDLAVEAQVTGPDGTVHALRVPLTAETGTRVDGGPAPIPVQVWVVIAVFVVLLLSIVVAWLILAQRAAGRVDDEGEAASAPVRPAPVAAELLTSA